MQEVSQISEFGKILIFLITGILLVAVTFFLARILSPNKPNPEKLTSYECGEEVVGSAWVPFNSRFYVIALIFLLFDVEMVFVFPWAIVFGNHQLIALDNRWGWFSFIEMFIFLGILILGLAYVWRKGDLNWIKPKPIVPTVDSKVPMNLYENLNNEQQAYKIRAFDVVPKEAEEIAAITTEPNTPAPIRKPMFKPTFKKPANE
jgi:NADH-quinone oxidoreductase subunit A